MKAAVAPGGSVTAGLAIYDTLQFVQCPIATYCIGQAASMGAVLLAAGTKGKRFCLPNSHVMIHQVSGGAQGTAADVERTSGFGSGLSLGLFFGKRGLGCGDSFGGRGCGSLL